MISITRHGLDGLDDAMMVMRCAFDPQFGEMWSAPQCAGVLSMPGADLLIARNPDTVGFALLRTIAEEAELMLLAVAPDARRTGVGRTLLEHSFRWAASAGAKQFFLEVRNDNPAIGLYEALGLFEVGRRHNYYRGNDGYCRDALTFRLSLS